MHLNDHEILDHLLGRADEELFRLADEEKRHVYGAEVFLRGVIEFSNVCNKSCHYCGLRAGSRGIARYRLEPGEILQAADEAVRFGAGTVVLQSGDDFSYSPEDIGELVREIKARHCVAVTLSLGDRNLDEYAYWRECGADRCLLKLETTSGVLYKRLRNGEDFRSRLHRLEGLRALGYEVGTGVITGLPGADLLDLLRDIRFLAELDPDMIAVGPFVPHPGTPLASEKPGSVDISNRATALLRLLVPHANIPATSALDALQPGGRAQALTRGCNVLMPSLTPEEHRKDYAIYPGKNARGMDGGQALAEAVETIRNLGLAPSFARGDARRSTHVPESPEGSPAGHHPGRTPQRREVVAD